MDASRSRRRQADAELAGVLGVSAGHEGGRFLVAYLDEAHVVLTLAQRFHDAVDAVAGEPEDHLDSPVEQRIDEDFRSCLGHDRSLRSYGALHPDEAGVSSAPALRLEDVF